MKHSTNRILAAVLVGLFGLFLTYGSLTSSDFPRGLYAPPQIHSGDGHWSDFAALNPTLAWNYGSQWHSFDSAGMDAYLDSLGKYNLQAILRNGDWKGNDTTGSYSDSIPYLAEHYSGGQHKQLEAELEYADASWDFFSQTGQSFYYFEHDRGREGPPPNTGTWYLDPSEVDSGECLYGPRKTLNQGNTLGEPGFAPGGYNYSQREFQIRIKSKIDKTGHPDAELAFLFILETWYNPPDTIPTYHVDDTLTLSVGDFAADEEYQEDSLETTVIPSGDTTFYCLRYKILYCDHVKTWIDWIEYMDMERAYYLFYNDSIQNATLDTIITQCSEIEQEHGADMVAWLQADEPRRNNFWACGVINDMAREALKGRYRHCYPPTVITSR
jgi:hypothetical protein